MKIRTVDGCAIVYVGDWAVRLTTTPDGWLDLNLMDDFMSTMKVTPQAGNVIRIKPDRRVE